MTTTTQQAPFLDATEPSERFDKNAAERQQVVRVDRVQRSARHLFDAECALHDARQSHVDAWIAAASDRLHDAVLEHDQALASQFAPGPL